MTLGEIKKIRESAKSILAAKADGEMTEDDKKILREYMGAGGVETPEASVEGTILADFYTPRAVVEAAWRLADGYAPGAKSVLEPSAGIGRFAENRATQKFTLCEIDAESARIAKILHPDAEVKNQPFQELFMDGRVPKKKWDGEKFDLAIGNPPYRANDGIWKGMGEGAEFGRMEEYFVSRSLDCLKDGGILAFVMPSSFLRNGASEGKRKIASKGRLLDAWRLPNGAFDTTDVGCDIVVVKKERGDVADFCRDKFFSENRHKVLGVEVQRMNNHWHRLQTECDLPEGETLSDVLTKIKAAPESKLSLSRPSAARGGKFKPRYEQPSLFGEDDFLPQPARKPAAEKNPARPQAEKSSAAPKPVEKAAQGADGGGRAEPKKMGVAQFLAHYGRRFDAMEMAAFRAMDRSGAVFADEIGADLEKWLENSEDFVQVAKEGGRRFFQHKAHFLSGNIAEKLEELEGCVSGEAYALLRAALPKRKSIDEIEIDPKERFAERVLLQDPLYVAPDEAYEGDAAQKAADAAPKSLRALFFEWAAGTPAARQAGLAGSIHEIDGFSPLTMRDLGGVGFGDVREYIGGVPVRARSWRGMTDSDKAEQAKEANELRERRKNVAIRLFNRFLREGLSEGGVKKVEDEYNRAYNSFVQADWSRMPLFVEGSADRYKGDVFRLSEQQWKGVSFLCHKGNGLLAYDVGVGKTAAGIFATMSQIQSGRSERPLVMVPKSVLPKWISDFKAIFPDVKINNLGNMGRNFTAKFSDGERGLKIEAGTVSLCTYQATEKISFSDEALKEDLLADLLDARAAPGEDLSMKDRQEDIERVKTLLGQAARVNGADYVLFDKTGFDSILVDEAHNFKNLVSSVRTETGAGGKKGAQEFAGVSGGKPSARAQKLFAMTQLVQRRNGGRNVFLLTATPFVNSPLEIYSMMSYMARDELRRRDIYNVTQFMQRYADFRYEYSVTPKGEIVSKQVMKSFKRLGELQNLITTYIDKVDGDEAGVIRPRKFAHTPRLRMTELQEKILEVEEARMDGAFKTPGAKGDAEYLVAIGNMRTAMLSPALLPHLPEYEAAGIKIPPLSETVECSPKLKFVCDALILNWKKKSDAGQFVYVPQGVEGFPFIKEYLVKNGVPAGAIECVTGGISADKKADIADAFNDKKNPLKILFGTSTLAEGVDLNGNSIAVFNTMLGWNPSESVQVEGRVWRQGNEQGHIHAVYPLVEDSIDSLLYQKHDEKSSRINALWSYKGDKLNVEDIKPEDLKFDLLRDPQKRAEFVVSQKKSEALQEASRLDAERSEISALVDRLDRDEAAFQYDRDDYERQRDGDFKAAADGLDNAKFLFSAGRIGRDELDEAERAFDKEKDWLKRCKRDMDRSRTRVEADGRKLAALGFGSKEAALARIEEIKAELQQTRKKTGEIEATFPAVLKAEIERNAEREKSRPTLSPEELAQEVSLSMMENLRPMSEVEAEIKAERKAKEALKNARNPREDAKIEANPPTAPPVEVPGKPKNEPKISHSDATLPRHSEPTPRHSERNEESQIKNEGGALPQFIVPQDKIFEIYQTKGLSDAKKNAAVEEYIKASLTDFRKKNGVSAAELNDILLAKRREMEANGSMAGAFVAKMDWMYDWARQQAVLEKAGGLSNRDEKIMLDAFQTALDGIAARKAAEGSQSGEFRLEWSDEKSGWTLDGEEISPASDEEAKKIVDKFSNIGAAALDEILDGAGLGVIAESERGEPFYLRFDKEGGEGAAFAVPLTQKSFADAIELAKARYEAELEGGAEGEWAAECRKRLEALRDAVRPFYDEAAECWSFGGKLYEPMSDGEAAETLKSLTEIDPEAILQAMDDADLGFFAKDEAGNPFRIDLNRDEDFVVPATREFVEGDIIGVAKTYYKEGLEGEPATEIEAELYSHWREMLSRLGGAEREHGRGEGAEEPVNFGGYAVKDENGREVHFSSQAFIPKSDLEREQVSDEQQAEINAMVKEISADLSSSDAEMDEKYQRMDAKNPVVIAETRAISLDENGAETIENEGKIVSDGGAVWNEKAERAEIFFDEKPFNPAGKDWIEKFGLQGVSDDEDRPLVNDFLRYSMDFYDSAFDESWTQSVFEDEFSTISEIFAEYAGRDGFPTDENGNPATDSPFFDALQDGFLEGADNFERKVREAVQIERGERTKIEAAQRLAAEMFGAVRNYDYEAAALAVEEGAPLTATEPDNDYTLLNDLAYDFNVVEKRTLGRILAAAKKEELAEVLDGKIGRNVRDRLSELEGAEDVADLAKTYENIEGFFRSACDKAGIDFSVLDFPVPPKEFLREMDSAPQSAAYFNEKKDVYFYAADGKNALEWTLRDGGSLEEIDSGRIGLRLANFDIEVFLEKKFDSEFDDWREISASEFDEAERMAQKSEIPQERPAENSEREAFESRERDLFDRELSAFIKGDLPASHIFSLGKPGEILQECGFPPNDNVVLTAVQLVKKSKQENHPFALSDVYGLEKALRNPVAVFEYGDAAKSQNVIVDLEKDGKHFLVGVHFKQSQRGFEVSDIRGIFNKDDYEWLRWIKQGKMIYGDKEKIQVALAQQRINLADVSKRGEHSPVSVFYLDCVDKILQSFGDVKGIFTKNFPEYAENRENYQIFRAFREAYLQNESINAGDAPFYADKFCEAMKGGDLDALRKFCEGEIDDEIAVAARALLLERRPDILAEIESARRAENHPEAEKSPFAAEPPKTQGVSQAAAGGRKGGDNSAAAGEAAETQGVSEPPASRQSAAVRVVENKEIDRVQIKFAQKPAAEVISKLKGAGWHWSQRNFAWQRPLTENGIRSANEIAAFAKSVEAQKTQGVSQAPADARSESRAAEPPKTQGVSEAAAGGREGGAKSRRSEKESRLEAAIAQSEKLRGNVRRASEADFADRAFEPVPICNGFSDAQIKFASGYQAEKRLVPPYIPPDVDSKALREDGFSPLMFCRKGREGEPKVVVEALLPCKEGERLFAMSARQAAATLDFWARAEGADFAPQNFSQGASDAQIAFVAARMKIDAAARRGDIEKSMGAARRLVSAELERRGAGRENPASPMPEKRKKTAEVER